MKNEEKKTTKKMQDVQQDEAAARVDTAAEKEEADAKEADAQQDQAPHHISISMWPYVISMGVLYDTISAGLRCDII